MAATSNTVIRSVISTTKSAKPLPYSKGILINNSMLYVSGQIGLDPKTGEFIGGNVESQTKQSMDNLGSVLEAAGATFNNVIKATVMMADIADYAKINEIYTSYFSGPLPARSAYAVSALPKNAKVEIEATAILGKIQDEE